MAAAATTTTATHSGADAGGHRRAPLVRTWDVGFGMNVPWPMTASRWPTTTFGMPEPPPTTTTRPETVCVELPARPPDVVYIAFFRHTTPSVCDGPYSLLASCWVRLISRRFEHCQVVFAWTRDRVEPLVTTFSTNKDRPSAYLCPSYTNENWETLPVPSANVATVEGVRIRTAMWNWCAHARDVPFNNCGYVCNFIPPVLCFPCCAYDAGGTGYFCAEQVAACLKETGLAEGDGLVPYRCVPDTIYDTLERHGARRTTLRRPQHRFVQRPNLW